MAGSTAEQGSTTNGEEVPLGRNDGDSEEEKRGSYNDAVREVGSAEDRRNDVAKVVKESGGSGTESGAN